MHAAPTAAVLAFVLATALTPPADAAACGFDLGFKALRDRIPDAVGPCLADEHHNPANGDGLQETAGGLLVWRKADNFTAFTDGYRTWVNGPFGVQERLNTETFPWEGAAPAPQGVVDGQARPDGSSVHPTATGYAVCGPGLGWDGRACVARIPSPPVARPEIR